MSEYNNFNNTELPQEPIPPSDFPTESSSQPEPPESSSPPPEPPENSAPQQESEFPEDSFAPSGIPENSFSSESFSQSEFSQGAQQGYSQHSSRPGNNSMSTAALVLGICSIVFICCGGSTITGALGIILALLSRGGGTMDGRAKSGMILSIIGLSLFIVIWGGYFIWFTATGLFDKAWKEYNSVPGSDNYEYNLPYDEDDHNDFWKTPYTDDDIEDADAKDL